MLSEVTDRWHDLRTAWRGCRVMRRRLGCRPCNRRGLEQSARVAQVMVFRHIKCMQAAAAPPGRSYRPIMIDPFGRAITYLRVSVTDRCDLRCVYCMSEDMEFLPKRDLLTLEELERLCGAFIRLGTRKIRITGGEPLVRRDVMRLFGKLGDRLGDGLDELTVTTNGSQLTKHAATLAAAGVKRINVSLDTLDPIRFTQITRWGKIEQTLDGIFAARAAGLAIKINAVAMKGVNEAEFDGMLAWCGEHGFDLCLIETMPMGDITGDRTDQYLPLSVVRARLAPVLDAGGYRLQDRRPGALLQRAGNRPADRLHHADDA